MCKVYYVELDGDIRDKTRQHNVFIKQKKDVIKYLNDIMWEIDTEDDRDRYYPFYISF